MGKEKKIRYDVVVSKNQIDFYLDFSKLFDDNILEEGCSLNFTGSINLDEDILNDIEKVIISKFPMNLDFAATEKEDPSTSKKEVVDSNAVNEEAEKTTKDNTVEEVYVPDNEEEVSAPDNDYYDVPTVEVPPAPDYTPSNKSKSNYKKTDKKPEKPEADVKEDRREDGIKDVQILAITTQIDLNKANYKELVQEAFAEAGIEVDVIPPIEELTYKQAIEIIKYGNKKFKR